MSNDLQKIKELETLIESILETLDYAGGDTYNPQIKHQIQFYMNEMRGIIDN
jgi:hypothetical protein